MTRVPNTTAVSGALLAGWLLLAGATAAADALPRGADGKPDFSGIWESTSGADYGLEARAGRPDAPPSAGVVDGGELPYQSWAVAQRDSNFAARATADRTRLQCYTLGVPRSVYFPAPFQIFQRERDLTLVGQFGAVRTIHKNGTEHPEGPFGFWLGDSRAKWEGDTLVVDVVDFNEETWLDRAGNFHSDALHVVERWTLLDADTIEYRATVEDSKVFTDPWSLTVLLQRHRSPGSSSSRTIASRTSTTSSTPFRRLASCPRAARPSSSAAIGERCDTTSASPKS